MAQNLPGRHRAPGRFNPISELTLLAKETAQPAVKGAAIVAASGGLIATFASPASAAPSVDARVAARGRIRLPARLSSAPARPPSRPTNTLSSIGFAAPAKAKAAKPIVIEDFVVKAQRAKAEADAQGEGRCRQGEGCRRQACRRAGRCCPGRRPGRLPPPSARPLAQPAARAPTTSRSPPAHDDRSRPRARRPRRDRPGASRSKRRASTRSTSACRARRRPPPASSGSPRPSAACPTSTGGTTPRGFDCSGFTSYVYRQAGHLHPAHGRRPEARVHAGQQPARR